MAWLFGLLALAASTLIAPAFSAAVIMWIGSFIIGLAAKSLDIAIFVFAAKFDAVIYSSLAPIIHELWTAFRDIANIVIIGMFTFIAIAMILDLKKFNARKMVANVLIVAVLINFSLLFSRLIITSSNLVASQFYCSMMVGAGQAQVCNPDVNPTGVLSTVIGASDGVGLRFMEFLGAPGFLEAWTSAGKVYDASGFGIGNVFALLYGLAALVLMIAAALVFLYICFLLVARGVLFLFLIIMSAPAFAAFLIPGKGKGYWDMWWKSLLNNAVFGPILVMLLWATFKISEGLIAGERSIGRGRSFDELFSSPESGSGYLALLTFALILGMLFASAKFATSFSKSIQGFDWGAMLPAYGAGILGRMGGAAYRQTIGRSAKGAQEDFAKRASKAASGSFAQKMYNFAANKAGGYAKRDGNIMRGRLGAEIAGAAKMKVDDFAGKAIGGFAGAQDKFRQDMAKYAKDLAYTEEQKKARTMEALEKHGGKAYSDAVDAHKLAKEDLEQKKKEFALEEANITKRHEADISAARDRYRIEQEARLKTGATKPSASETAAKKSLETATTRRKLEMDKETEKIKTATQHLNAMQQSLADSAEAAAKLAVKAGDLPDQFASAGDIARETVKSSYTSLLRAQIGKVGALAEDVEKAAGKTKQDPNATVKYAKQIVLEKANQEQPKKTP